MFFPLNKPGEKDQNSEQSFELFELGTKPSKSNIEALTLNVEIFASKWHIHFVIQLKDLELVIEMSQMS